MHENIALMDHRVFQFPPVHKRTTMLAHCNLKQNTWLCLKQSSFFSFYALPSGGKWKDAVVHLLLKSFIQLIPIVSKYLFGFLSCSSVTHGLPMLLGHHQRLFDADILVRNPVVGINFFMQEITRRAIFLFFFVVTKG